MASSANYELVVDDFKHKGVQITMRKRNGKQLFYMIASFVGIFLPSCNYSLDEMQSLQFILLFGFVCIFIILFVNTVSSISSETLLIISSVGINVQRSTILGTSSIFYNLQEIQDVVIVEAVTMYNIVFQLVLLPKNESFTQKSITQKNNVNNKLHPLFQSFKPKLQDLQTIYQHIQEKLFLIHQDDR
ncbi:hypothetical protein ACF0H5_003056 [Mactra antiquata]